MQSLIITNEKGPYLTYNFTQIKYTEKNKKTKRESLPLIYIRKSCLLRKERVSTQYNEIPKDTVRHIIDLHSCRIYRTLKYKIYIS